MSGFASSALGNITKGLKDMHTAMKLSFHALVGGTVSAIGGGKFANGAVSAAMVYLFNDHSETHGGIKKYTLGIHTNAAAEGLNPTRGHAWISITDNKTGEIHTYALYADQSLPMHESDATGGILQDRELNYTWKTNSFVQITQNQYDSIAPYLKVGSNTWYTDYTCSNYAIDVYNMGVGMTFESTRFPVNLANQIGY